MAAAALLLVAVAPVGLARPAPAAAPAAVPACGTPAAPLVLTGAVTSAEARTYRQLPFLVPVGAQRVEVGYSWAEVQEDPTPAKSLTATTLDLGLWDEDGYRASQGFRGWSGSRQGRLPKRIFVQADGADRGYEPGPINSGQWSVELGIAAVSPMGATWRVEISCGPAGPVTPRPSGTIDPARVARSGPGWYHGDFHVHGYHSNPAAPDWDGVVAQLRAARLDFAALTDYVVTTHHHELGPTQAANPDLLLWPGREIITYFGHTNAIGETPGVIEYRHGFEDITLGQIQRATKDAGALFQVNHPTIFPGPVFSSMCRGCEFTLGDGIDWNLVDTIEIVTGPAVADGSDLGGPKTPGGQNPFVPTAIRYWEDVLRRGYKVTPVSGSDSKGVDPVAERARKGYGSSATAVYADELSRAGLRKAIAAGHVYVRARGVAASPALDLSVTTADGQHGTFGDVLRADTATMTVRVQGAAGQTLRAFRNGQPVLAAPIASADQSVTVPIARVPADEGPLGTFWRVETGDATGISAIGNAVFLQPPA
jgi:hypothetical protein